MKRMLVIISGLSLVACSCAKPADRPQQKNTVKAVSEAKAKPKGCIYYRKDRVQAYRQAELMMNNRIFQEEGIVMLEAPAGQKEDWIFDDGKEKYAPICDNDSIYEEALDYFGVDWDKYGLIR